jgi:hypothetical protein
MTYAITILQAAITALERIGVFDQRVAELYAAIKILEEVNAK